MSKMQLVKFVYLIYYCILHKKGPEVKFLWDKSLENKSLDFQVSDPISIQKIQIKPIKFWW